MNAVTPPETFHTAARRTEVDPLPLRRAAVALGGCAVRTVGLLARGRITQPRPAWRRLNFADGTTSTVYRETVIKDAEPSDPAVLVVTFRLRGVHRSWAHAAFRAESVLNTVLFAGFDGLVTKLWMSHDDHGRYRGIYQWDGADSAVAYVSALWWVLALVSERDSIRYVVLPGKRLDEFLTPRGTGHDRAWDPGLWWQPIPPGVRTGSPEPAVGTFGPVSDGVSAG